MATIITAPEPLPNHSPLPLVFLAGSIDQGQATQWQTQLMEQCSDCELVFANPRRGDWDASWGDGDPRLTEQILWEQRGLELADLVVVVFDPKGKAPVTLLELGQTLSRGTPCIVCCPPGYWRRTNVLETAARYKATVVEDLDQVAEQVQAWQPQDTIRYNGRFLKMLNRNGWEFVARTNASAVVAIGALTANDEVVLVEQDRLPLGDHGQTVIELPAGLVGDDGHGHDILDAARRELEEETGYTASTLRAVTAGPSSAGLTNEIITMVIADDLTKIGDGGGIDGENIIVHAIPKGDVGPWLASEEAKGKLIDPKVWMGLFHLGISSIQ